jgi:hypothetical protein
LITLDELVEQLPLLAGATAVLGAIFVLIAIRYFRRSRYAPYWTQRRAAGRRGLRVILLSVFFFTISGLLCGMTLIIDYIDEPEDDVAQVDATATDNPTPSDEVATRTAGTPTPDTPEPTLTITPQDETPTPSRTATTLATRTHTATSLPATETGGPTLAATMPDTATMTATPTETPLPTATFTTRPSMTASSTDTAEPSATSTPSPTDTLQPSATPTSQPTATATLVPTLLADRSGGVIATRTPRSNATLQITEVSDQITGEWQAVDSTQALAAGFERLYVFINFDNLESGVRWERQLLRDGTIIQRRTALWGTVSSGDTMLFFSDPNHFPPGDYEVQLFLGTNSDPADTITLRVE